MNIQLSKSNRGSVLLISLVTATIILTSLAAYLIMISNERQSVTRSQAWSSCVPTSPPATRCASALPTFATT